MTVRFVGFSLLAAMLVGCTDDSATERGCPRGSLEADVLAGGEGRFPAIAGSVSHDDVTVAWESTVGGPVMASRRRAGRWSPPMPVSPAGATTPVVVYAGDHPVVISDAAPGLRRGLWSSRGRDNGGWTAPQPITTPAGTSVRMPAAAGRRDGTLAVAWRADPRGALMTRFQRDGRWQPPVVVVAEGTVRYPAVAFTADGVVLAWIQVSDGGRRVMTARVVGDQLTAPRPHSPAGEVAADLVAATSADGTFVIAWRGERADRIQQVRAAIRDRGGRWTPTRALGEAHTYPRGLPRPPGPLSRAPSVAVRTDGSAVVAWPEHRDGRDRTVIAELDASASVLDESVPGGDAAGGSAALGALRDGRVVAVWEHLDRNRLSLRRVVSSPDGTTADCRTLTPAGREPASPVLAGTGDRMWAAWSISNDSSIEAAEVLE